MIRSTTIDGTEYCRVGLLLLPVVDLTAEELDGLLTDSEAVRDDRPLPRMIGLAKSYLDSVADRVVAEADARDQARRERGS